MLHTHRHCNIMASNGKSVADRVVIIRSRMLT